MHLCIALMSILFFVKYVFLKCRFCHIKFLLLLLILMLFPLLAAPLPSMFLLAQGTVLIILEISVIERSYLFFE